MCNYLVLAAALILSSAPAQARNLSQGRQTGDVVEIIKKEDGVTVLLRNTRLEKKARDCL